MKKFQNIILLVAVVVLVALPLIFIQKPEPEPGQKEVEIFTGSDDQAKNMITQIRPDYKPWVESLLSPPSGEIESMLFSLQAALGAGFIGYWLGTSVTKAKEKRIS